MMSLLYGPTFDFEARCYSEACDGTVAMHTANEPGECRCHSCGHHGLQSKADIVAAYEAHERAESELARDDARGL